MSLSEQMAERLVITAWSTLAFLLRRIYKRLSKKKVEQLRTELSQELLKLNPDPYRAEELLGKLTTRTGKTAAVSRFVDQVALVKEFRTTVKKKAGPKRTAKRKAKRKVSKKKAAKRMSKRKVSKKKA